MARTRLRRRSRVASCCCTDSSLRATPWIRASCTSGGSRRQRWRSRAWRTRLGSGVSWCGIVASYYGLGEHFDTLNRAHTVVKNASEDNAGREGRLDLQADAVFHEHDGLWAVGGYDGGGDV